MTSTTSDQKNIDLQLDNSSSVTRKLDQNTCLNIGKKVQNDLRKLLLDIEKRFK